MRPCDTGIVAALVVVSSCFSIAQPQSDSGTGIEGVITVGPIHGGPARDGIPHSQPLRDATFVVENERGVVASFTTDDQGRFRVSLTPGHYTVTKKERPKAGAYGPFSVDVETGKLTNVAWNCDDGRM